MEGGALATGVHAHAVAFFEHDGEVVDSVAQFAAEGVDLDERVIVIATPEHRAGIEQALVRLGVDPDEPPAAGHFVVLDAQDTLDRVMSDDGPDRGRFLASVGQLVLDAAADGARVRIYGEMVGLLWDQGDVTSAILLEGLWNELAGNVDFTLMCGYPTSLVDQGGLAELHDVCTLHSKVQAPPRYAATPPDDSELSHVFLPVPEAVAATRRFVAAALERISAPELVPDAELIVSELATNAVLHARSPFRVSVDQSVDVVCISVQDAGDGLAEQDAGGLEAHAPGGRGMAIVDALARSWGCDPLQDGKVVWAELVA